MWHKYWISAVRSDRAVTNARQKSPLATTMIIDKNKLLRIAEVASQPSCRFMFPSFSCPQSCGVMLQKYCWINEILF